MLGELGLGYTLASATGLTALQSDLSFCRISGLPTERQLQLGVEKETCVRFEPETFVMGIKPRRARDADAEPHKVTLTRPFCLKATEVTQREWRRVMGTNPAYFGAHGDDRPVERVSWMDAVVFLNRLSGYEGFETCYTMSGCVNGGSVGCPPDATYCENGFNCATVHFKGLGCEGYRLPTEAEWELAARTRSVRSSRTSLLNRRPHTPRRAGPSKAGRSGLFDMYGNVWEWTGDWRADYPPGDATDPQGPLTGTYRIVRGSAWDRPSNNSHPQFRYAFEPSFRDYSVGFRAARTLLSDR